MMSHMFYIKNFRIDASSDTLVAKNDKDFEYFNYYQSIFPKQMKTKREKKLLLATMVKK